MEKYKKKNCFDALVNGIVKYCHKHADFTYKFFQIYKAFFDCTLLKII